jgi:hypothetical protein
VQHGEWETLVAGLGLGLWWVDEEGNRKVRAVVQGKESPPQASSLI